MDGVYTPESLEKWNATCGLKDGQWVKARPMGYNEPFSLGRLKLAWRVFKGELDALQWIGQDKLQCGK